MAFRLRFAPAERRLAAGLSAALILSGAAFWPGEGKDGLDRSDALLAVLLLASGIALWTLGALLCRPDDAEKAAEGDGELR